MIYHYLPVVVCVYSNVASVLHIHTENPFTVLGVCTAGGGVWAGLTGQAQQG